MRSIFVSWLAVISPLMLAAQDQDPRVVNALGLYQKLDNLSLEASIGEIAVSTLTSGNKSVAVTQGFLQPREITPCPGVDISYYPNPTRDILTITATGCDSQIITVEVIDIWGRSITQLQPSEANQISLAHFSQGVYLLKVRLRNGIQRAINVIKVSE